MKRGKGTKRVKNAKPAKTREVVEVKWKPEGPVLLEPVVPTQRLVESFKLYVKLKDELLDETDYVWAVRWGEGKNRQRKAWTGVGSQKAAEAWAKTIHEKLRVHPELEKKVRKSGVLKLSKAFGIKTEIIEKTLDPAGGSAYYMVRASAPNKQTTDRTGFCDRREKGKGDNPWDHIDSTALTRAINRAIMGLLGGENTAEEFEEDSQPDEKKEPPKKPATAPASKTVTVVDTSVIGKERGVLPTPLPESPVPVPPAKKSKEELQRELDEKFNQSKGATSGPIADARRRLWAAAQKVSGMSKEKLKADLCQAYGTKEQQEGKVPFSTKDLTEAQILEATKALEGLARERGV